MTEKCCEGYTLCSPAGPGRHPFLIDMDGNIIHEWSSPGQGVKMLSDGSLLTSKRDRHAKDPLAPGPIGPPPGPPPKNPKPGDPPRPHPWFDAIELIQEAWDGQEEWSFTDWDDDGTGVMMSRQHHDVQREGNPVGYYAPGQEYLPKGKTLILGHKNVLIPEICKKELGDDAIYEVDWEGNLTGFEWYGVDHFNEMGFDQSAKEAIQNAVHFDEDKGYSDWLHLNTISVLGKNHWWDNSQDEQFHPDNIMISSRSANFIAIISRDTGNIVWKAGPDFIEGTKEYRLGQFVGQHHPHMIPKDLPGEGNILVFDNGGKSGYGGSKGFPRYERDYSRVIEFDPVTFEIVWQYGAETGPEKFHSHYISSTQRLPNGNTLIDEGANGRIFEITIEKEIVWEFVAPSKDGGENAIYRAFRIPPEWVPENPVGYREWSVLFEKVK